MKYKGIPIENISIFKTPAIYIELSVLLIKDLFSWIAKMIITRGILMLGVLITWLIISYVDALQVSQLLSRQSKIFFTLQDIGLY